MPCAYPAIHVMHRAQRQRNAAAEQRVVFAVDDKLTVFGDYAVICRTFHAKESFDELLGQQG